MKIFLDANIIFSSSQAGSPIRPLVDLLLKNYHVITCSYAVDEAIRNISSKYPEWMPGYKSLISKIKIHNSILEVQNIEINPKDYPIIAAAIGNHCSHLLTGDFHHFKHLFGKTIQGVKIVSAKFMADELKHLGLIKI